MLFKVLIVLGLIGFGIALYFGKLPVAYASLGVASISLLWTLFGKKSDPPSGPSFKIKSGKNSNNNQSTGNITQNFK